MNNVYNHILQYGIIIIETKSICSIGYIVIIMFFVAFLSLLLRAGLDGDRPDCVVHPLQLATIDCGSVLATSPGFQMDMAGRYR